MVMVVARPQFHVKVSSKAYQLGVRNFFTYGTPFKFNLSRRPHLVRPLAEKLFQSIPIRLLPAALLADRASTVAIIAAIGRDLAEDPGEGTVFDGYSDVEGHIAALGIRVDHGDKAETRFFDPRFPLLSAFSAFPNGIRLLPARLGIVCLEAADVVAFLEENEQAIEDFTIETLLKPKPQGWSYEGNYLILGFGSIVRCVQHEIVVNEDGSAAHVWHVQTASRHIFDGSFLWGWWFDPKHRGAIFGAGFQAGKHPWYDLDTVNITGGAGLFDFMNRAGRDMLTVWEEGRRVTPGDTRLIGDYPLRVAGWLLAGADRFSPVGQYLRINGPPNTKAEIVELDDDALDRVWATPPEAFAPSALPLAKWVGVTVDGMPTAMVEPVFGDPIGRPGEELVLARLEALTGFAMNQDNWARIRADVLALASARLRFNYVAQSAAELFDALLGDPESRFAIEKIVCDAILAPAMPRIETEIESAGGDAEARAALREGVRAQIRRAVTQPLFADGGALRSALRLQILARRLALLDEVSLVGRAAKAAGRAASARAELVGLREAVPMNDGEARAIEAAIGRCEAAIGAADREKARLEEFLGDLDNAISLRQQLEAAERDHARRLFPLGIG